MLFANALLEQKSQSIEKCWKVKKKKRFDPLTNPIHVKWLKSPGIFGHLVTVGRKCATSPTMKEKVSKASVATLEGKFLSLFEFGLLFCNMMKGQWQYLALLDHRRLHVTCSKSPDPANTWILRLVGSSQLRSCATHCWMCCVLHKRKTLSCLYKTRYTFFPPVARFLTFIDWRHDKDWEEAGKQWKLKKIMAINNILG